MDDLAYTSTMLLADPGAEVTKIEPPSGDISRQAGASRTARRVSPSAPVPELA